MSNDNTAKPTAGPWARNKYGRICSGAAGHETILCADIAIPCSYHDLHSEAVANSELLLEAGNVHHETGLTPRQLALQRGELLKALKYARRFVDVRDVDTTYISAIIAKVEAKP